MRLNCGPLLADFLCVIGIVIGLSREGSAWEPCSMRFSNLRRVERTPSHREYLSLPGSSPAVLKWQRSHEMASFHFSSIRELHQRLLNLARHHRVLG